MRAATRADPGVAVFAAQPGRSRVGEIESRWLGALRADLRAGRIAHIMIRRAIDGSASAGEGTGDSGA